MKTAEEILDLFNHSIESVEGLLAEIIAIIRRMKDNIQNKCPAINLKEEK